MLTIFRAEIANENEYICKICDEELSGRYSFKKHIIHYHNDTERTAREAASVAENIYFQVTSYYQFEPDSKTHIIIKDVNDYSNGAAYFF